MSVFLQGLLLWGGSRRGLLIKALKFVWFIIHDKDILKTDNKTCSQIKCSTFIQGTIAVGHILLKKMASIFHLHELIGCSTLLRNVWPSQHILRVVFHPHEWSFFNISPEKVTCFLCLEAYLLNSLPYDVMIVAAWRKFCPNIRNKLPSDSSTEVMAQRHLFPWLSYLLHHSPMCNIKLANDN